MLSENINAATTARAVLQRLSNTGLYVIDGGNARGNRSALSRGRRHVTRVCMSRCKSLTKVTGQVSATERRIQVCMTFSIRIDLLCHFQNLQSVTFVTDISRCL